MDNTPEPETGPHSKCMRKEVFSILKQTISTPEQVDLATIDFPDIRWLHGVFYCNSSGSGRDKKYHPWSGVKTDLGEIEEKVWCQIAESLIDREGESALLKSLIEWESDHNYLRGGYSGRKRRPLKPWQSRNMVAYRFRNHGILCWFSNGLKMVFFHNRMTRTTVL